jgi:hypothetical protein
VTTKAIVRSQTVTLGYVIATMALGTTAVLFVSGKTDVSPQFVRAVVINEATC